jgi:uncharacterized protein
MTDNAAPPANDNSADPKVKAKACPICSKPLLERFKPFCSKRCADVDLHRWMSGSYAIPVIEDEPLSDET